MTSMQNLIQGTFNAAFNKLFYDELVIGKLAHTECKDAANRGDEISFLMPGTAHMFNYDGGTLPDAEKVQTSTAKVRLDRVKATHYKMPELEKVAIENSEDNGQKVNVIKEYGTDLTKQFAAAVDCAYADLYPAAGVRILDSDGADEQINISGATNGKLMQDILAYMRTQYQKGDGEGHNNWIDGQMIAILPPEAEMYLGKLEILGQVESGHRKIEKGFIGVLEGWKIYISNNIANPSSGIFYPLFGRKGKTLAGGVGRGFKTVTYNEEKTFDSAIKAYGIYGTGAPRADLLGTVKLQAPNSWNTFKTTV